MGSSIPAGASQRVPEEKLLVSNEVALLRQQLTAQQGQIGALRQTLTQKDTIIKQLEVHSLAPSCI